MKNVLKFLPFFLMAFVVFSCSKDDDSCETDPSVTVAENIVGTWIIDGASDETVTFNANGSGSSAEGSFEFSATNNGNDYNNFNWAMEGDTVVVVTYDYSPDTPVTPFIVSEDYKVVSNECDQIEMIDGFENETTLTK